MGRKHARKGQKFRLPGKKALLEDENIKVVLVDVIEYQIERPKKQKKWYSCKKKKHIIKAQIFINKATVEIICVAEDCNRIHDFNLYKDTIGACVLDSIKEQADSGYQEIAALHHNSEASKKKSHKVVN